MRGKSIQLSWLREILWLGMLCIATSKDLFPSKVRATQSQDVTPIQFATSIQGTHALSTTLQEGQYVLTAGNGRHDAPIEWVWQRPILKGRGHVLRGIVFLAHGCSHHATDFFPQSLSCPKCIGLPEEIRITNGLLRQQYAVVAVSSTGHCWGEEDFERTKKILEIVAAELGHPLPLYAIGASSGGSFVAHLPNFMAGFKAVVVQIMSVQGKSLLQSGGGEYPPSLWIAMQRDERTLRSVEKTVHHLTKHHKIAELVEAKEIPLEENFFSDRISNLSPAVSSALVATLQECNLLDESKYLLQDPRVTDWRVCLQRNDSLWMSIAATQDSLESDRSPISEELNVAYAMHELTANPISDMINFIMKYK